MTDLKNQIFEDATPNAEYLIKSIAEQGYSLETSLSDLMDNSITAKATKIEVLVDIEKSPFTLYLTDNGLGMNEDKLKACMQFPSASPDTKRDSKDLGRFGLGMKTASFSQTRRFTVISKKKGTTLFSARTWDVGLLKKNQWKLLVNSDEEIDELVSNYKILSDEYLNTFDDFEPNTIIVWSGLYKFEDYLEDENRNKALKKELTEVTTEHLSLVFHRFMQRKQNPLSIRINNHLLKPFNPFPTYEKDFRNIEYKQRSFGLDSIKIEGFVLPSRSISEDKQGLTHWTTKNRGLMDMEGIYIYRLDRIIIFGGWNGLIKKAPRLQLARLRVEIGNNADHLLHLNVAKSQVIIPHDLKKAFEAYIDELKIEAEREYYNKGITKFSNNKKQLKSQLFKRISTNKGTILEINNEFPLLNTLIDQLHKNERSKLNLLIKMINTTINKIRQNHSEVTFVGLEDMDGISIDDLVLGVKELKDNGIHPDVIRKHILPDLGYKYETLPNEIYELLKEK